MLFLFDLVNFRFYANFQGRTLTIIRPSYAGFDSVRMISKVVDIVKLEEPFHKTKIIVK